MIRGSGQRYLPGARALYKVRRYWEWGRLLPKDAAKHTVDLVRSPAGRDRARRPRAAAVAPGLPTEHCPTFGAVPPPLQHSTETEDAIRRLRSALAAIATA
ncbi:hypothetical protein [Streptomyces sp. QHH-9511]|uniref:hypothetical protein n=1 Tax=Streptomyces sp. QHH-9511 TaxID=2684468 RepID=UPI0013908B47|nr:hypothetical protein [Streptomyces sp. QHH-9511]